MAKKYKRNNIRSPWKHDDIKIVFSDPEIQASESVVHVRDVNDILYYYYTIKVYRKTNKNWKKELVSYTWNSPALLCIEKMDAELLKDDFDDGSWQMASDGDSVRYKKSFDTDSIVNEDYYQIGRVVTFYRGERLESFFIQETAIGGLSYKARKNPACRILRLRRVASAT